MISNFKLPFIFDSKLLQLDLDQIAPTDWTKHFNTGYYDGDWEGVALRSVGGIASQMYPDPRATGTVADTHILDRCPNLRALLTVFRCPLPSVRLLRLAAGSKIREHRDYDLGFEDGSVRLHIPIVTNAAVDFFLDAHRIEMREGECWYLDLSLPHWVENRGASDRVHLVIDCRVNEWLRDLLSAAECAHVELVIAPPVHEECASSTFEWERFRQAVFADQNLQHRLQATADPESFTRLVVSVGRDSGYRFTAADVEEAMCAARRSWIQRWID